MSVAVISKTGIVLMPTSEYRARKLLDSGKAIIYGYRPFTIQLTERETGDVQPVELCVDTGYIHIGVSVKSEKHEYLGLQVDTLTDEKAKHDDRRMYRRQRRNRKRYRKSRFDNRKRKSGWLAPSLEHKKEINLQIITAICGVYPIADITLEMGNFDTQVLKAKEEGKQIPQGTDYQHGERYGIATLREAVFTRDGYKCQCCDRGIKDGAILHAHHIQYRSQGGTNRMSNLITVCEKCHTPANHKPGGKLYGWKPKIASFKYATYMTAVRWQLYRKVKEMFPGIHVKITYGAETKERRRILDIKKSHVNDAFVMGQFHTSTAGMGRHVPGRNCLMAESAGTIRRIPRICTDTERKRCHGVSEIFAYSVTRSSLMISSYLTERNMRQPDAITREPERSCYRRRSRNPWRNSQFISMQVDTIHRSLLRREECAK